jgi:hypothetical protein
LSVAGGVSAGDLAPVLEQPIATADRRLPRLEEPGTSDIARDAGALVAKAVARLAELASTPGDVRRPAG